MSNLKDTLLLFYYLLLNLWPDLPSITLYFYYFYLYLVFVGHAQ